MPRVKFDLDEIERAALAAQSGGRKVDPHPFRPKTEAVLLNDEGDGLVEGERAEIELAAALRPAVVIELIRVAREHEALLARRRVTA